MSQRIKLKILFQSYLFETHGIFFRIGGRIIRIPHNVRAARSRRGSGRSGSDHHDIRRRSGRKGSRRWIQRSQIRGGVGQ